MKDFKFIIKSKLHPFGTSPLFPRPQQSTPTKNLKLPFIQQRHQLCIHQIRSNIFTMWYQIQPTPIHLPEINQPWPIFHLSRANHIPHFFNLQNLLSPEHFTCRCNRKTSSHQKSSQIQPTLCYTTSWM